MAKIIIISDLDPRESAGAVGALLDKVFAGNQCPLARSGGTSMVKTGIFNLSAEEIPDSLREMLRRAMEPSIEERPPKTKPQK